MCTVHCIVSGGSNESTVRPSYEVCLLLAEKKPHTICKELINPTALLMASAVLGEKVSKSLSSVSLSNNTLRSRIDEMAENVRKALINTSKNCTSSAVQLDEN